MNESLMVLSMVLGGLITLAIIGAFWYGVLFVIRIIVNFIFNCFFKQKEV